MTSLSGVTRNRIIIIIIIIIIIALQSINRPINRNFKVA